MLATEAAKRQAAAISAFAEAAKAEKAVEAAHSKLEAAQRKAAVAGAAVFVEYSHVLSTEARATDSRAMARAAADAAGIASMDIESARAWPVRARQKGGWVSLCTHFRTNDKGVCCVGAAAPHYT